MRAEKERTFKQSENVFESENPSADGGDIAKSWKRRQKNHNTKKDQSFNWPSIIFHETTRLHPDSYRGRNL